MYFIGKKWLIRIHASKKRMSTQTQYEPLIIEDDWISFGYVRRGESIIDLQ